jgi:hypothetical protein
MVHLRSARAAGVAIASAAVLASVAACGSQNSGGALPSASGGSTVSGSAPLTSSPTVAATSSQASTAIAQALTSYRAAFADWAAVTAVANKADYQNPRLADHMSGQALETVTQSVYVNTNVDQAITKGAPVLHPSVGEVVPANDPTQVVVNDCVDTSNWLLWTSDGSRLYNNVPGGHRKTQSLVVYANGAWKVSQLYMQKVGTCE